MWGLFFCLWIFNSLGTSWKFILSTSICLGILVQNQLADNLVFFPPPPWSLHLFIRKPRLSWFIFMPTPLWLDYYSIVVWSVVRKCEFPKCFLFCKVISLDLGTSFSALSNFSAPLYWRKRLCCLLINILNSTLFAKPGSFF